MNTKQQAAPLINIRIDGTHFQIHQNELSGTALKQLAGIPAANLLFREVHGPGEDEQIQNETIVQLKSGDAFYEMPPGNFGLS